MTKSSLGTIRQLPNGRPQLRYTDLLGKQRSGGTYATRKAANEAATLLHADLLRKEWSAPEMGSTKFKDHAEKVMETRRADVSPSTFRNYQSLLKQQLMPTFGHTRLQDIGVGHVDAWWARQAARPVNRRNSYFVLSMLMKHAVRCRHIKSTRCLVDKAGRDVARPRPTFALEQVERYGDLDAIP